jgi:nitrogen fixation protein
MNKNKKYIPKKELEEYINLLTTIDKYARKLTKKYGDIDFNTGEILNE